MLKEESLVGAVVYYDGTRLRDLIADRHSLPFSHSHSHTHSVSHHPSPSTKLLLGQQNDSRMNVALALTAAYHGAALANHVEVTALLKDAKNADGEPMLSGAKVRDTLTGQEWEIKAKGIVNATGPFTGNPSQYRSRDTSSLCRLDPQDGRAGDARDYRS